jgi:hypothetical protein
VSTAAWTVNEDGYLGAYQWAGALAGGSPMPTVTTALQLGPGEIAHADFAPVALAGYFGEDTQYRSSFLLVGGPVGLAVTGAASLARNAAKKAEARRAAVPRWHALGMADVVVTSQRLAVSVGGQTESLWYAELGPAQLAAGTGGMAAVQVQPAGHPVLRIESAWAPLLYVYVHHLVDGRPPAVPMPAGLLERAKREGWLR